MQVSFSLKRDVRLNSNPEQVSKAQLESATLNTLFQSLTGINIKASSGYFLITVILFYRNIMYILGTNIQFTNVGPRVFLNADAPRRGSYTAKHYPYNFITEVPRFERRLHLSNTFVILL